MRGPRHIIAAVELYVIDVFATKLFAECATNPVDAFLHYTERAAGHLA